MSEAEQNQPEVTTAPEAVTVPTEQQPVAQFDREYVEKLRRENAAYRTKAKEAQEAADAAKLAAEREKLDEVERLKAEKADAEKKIAEIEARAVNAERRAALTGKVADADAALKLLDADAHLFEDGNVNVDALLESYPFLAPTKPGVPSTPGAGGGLNTRTINNAALQEQIKNARTRSERIALQRQLQKGQR